MTSSDLTREGPDLTELRRLEAELADWAVGRRSHTNEFMAVEAGSEHRVATLRDIAVADAAEVVRLSAAVAALHSNAAPWLLAQAEAVERVRALCDAAERDVWRVRSSANPHATPARLWTTDVRAALGSAQ